VAGHLAYTIVRLGPLTGKSGKASPTATGRSFVALGGASPLAAALACLIGGR